MSRRAPIPFPRPTRSSLFRFPRRSRERAVLTLLRAGFGPVSRLSPDLSARCAEMLFRTPPRNPRLRGERETLARGVFRRVRLGDRSLATWAFGEGPAVLLVHGWGGHAGRLSRYVDPLVARGFSVIAFDAGRRAPACVSRASL